MLSKTLQTIFMEERHIMYLDNDDKHLSHIYKRVLNAEWLETSLEAKRYTYNIFYKGYNETEILHDTLYLFEKESAF